MLEKRQEAVLIGYFGKVTNLAVTNDNKYIVSGFVNNSIIIWNLLEKTQEAVLEGCDTFESNFVVTSDSNYVVYCCIDNTISV